MVLGVPVHSVIISRALKWVRDYDRTAVAIGRRAGLELEIRIMRIKIHMLLQKSPLIHTFVYLVLHPRSNGTVIHVDMDCIRLRVQTVPATDPVTNETHTAYLVFRKDDEGGIHFHASGWTLRDAIDSFCEWFKVDRHSIKILRPFLPQRMETYDY